MDPYAVLKVTQDSTSFEIRHAYRKALLKNHPDKIEGKAMYTIDQVNKAYKTLVDKNDAPNANTVPLDIQFSDVRDLAEFEFNESLQQFSRSCRCGQDFVLTINELEANGDADEIAVQCSGCTLWILVQYEVEDT